MPLEINEGSLNLPDLAGMFLTLTKGHDLDKILYVYGVQDRNSNQIYLDVNLPHVERMSKFIQEQGFVCRVGLPTRPNIRPAIALSRSVRQNNIKGVTRVCAFVAFVMHGIIDPDTLPKLPKKSTVRLYPDSYSEEDIRIIAQAGDPDNFPEVSYSLNEDNDEIIFSRTNTPVLVTYITKVYDDTEITF